MRDFMTHFDDDAWIAFARGLARQGDQRRMRGHLDSGCTECRQAHETWKRFVDMSVQESCDAARDSAVRAVKAALALRRKAPFRAGLACLAEPVFDSLEEPMPRGFRGVASPRLLLYEAGSFLVDLRIEPNQNSQVALTGQVVDVHAEGVTCGAGVVLLQKPGVVLGQTIANSLGEFQLDFERQEDLGICLEIPNGTMIEVALPNMGEPAGANLRLGRIAGQ